MSEDEGNQFIGTINTAVDRIYTRLSGLLSGYLFILQAENIAVSGDSPKLEMYLNDLNKTLEPVGMGTEQHFLSILFLDLVAEMEVFFSSLIQATVIEHSKKLGATEFKLSEIIDTNSTHELVVRAADETINKLMYKKPMEYLDSICDLLSVEKECLAEPWLNYVEAKARRDLGIHNSWRCNSTYLRKLNEANIPTTANEGDIMIPYYDPYIRGLHEHLRTLVYEIHKQLFEKYK